VFVLLRKAFEIEEEKVTPTPDAIGSGKNAEDVIVKATESN
jgi:hypothetical protein